MNQELQTKINNLTTEVEQTKQVQQSAIALVQGLRQQLTDALANANSDADAVAAIQAIADGLDASTNALADAVAANTGTDATDPTGTDATDPTA